VYLPIDFKGGPVASDSIRIRLHLRAITAIGVVVDSLRDLVVEVETARSWSRCPACGFKCRRVHDRRIRKIGDRQYRAGL